MVAPTHCSWILLSYSTNTSLITSHLSLATLAIIDLIIRTIVIKKIIVFIVAVAFNITLIAN